MKESRHIKYRKLVEAGCSKEQIKALMLPGAPTLWHEDEHGLLYPLDGRRNIRQNWASRAFENATFKPAGKSHN